MRRSRVLVPVVAATILVLVPSAAAAPAPVTGFVRPSSLQPVVPRGATALGRLATTQLIDVGVVLAPAHPDRIAALLAAQNDPSSPLYQQYLAPGEFAARFGPSASEIRGVTAWLGRSGFSDVTVGGFEVRARATAGTAERAFGISFERYRTRDRRVVFTALQAPLVPSDSSSGIVSILGLSDIAHARPRLDRTPHIVVRTSARARPSLARVASPCPAAANAANSAGAWTADQVGAAYGVGSLVAAGQRGTGKRIAMVELAPHSATDTSTYAACFGLSNSVTTRTVDTGGTTDANGTIEADLDIEEAATQAPGSAIVSYEGPNTDLGEYDVYSAIVGDDATQVISSSWGLCEPSQASQFFSSEAALHMLFAQAAAQGQTLLAATGDAGSEGCFDPTAAAADTSLQVGSPANDPTVTGVGGTALLAPGDEVVWNDCQGQSTLAQCKAAFGVNLGGGGGGLSQVYTRPPWQPAIAGGSCALASCRQVPDISANAGVGTEFYAGGWVALAGTSVATPTIAGIVADVDTGCLAPIGDLAPRLFALAKHNGVYGSALFDVTSGDNDLTRTNSGAFPARGGDDLATGLGTPLAAGWSCPEVTSISAASAAPGTRLTITGFALAQSTITFGNATAAVVSRSPTSATIVVPDGSGSVTVRAADELGRGARSVNFTYPGSPTSARAYRTVATDGGIFSFGGAPFYGSTGSLHLDQPIVGMTLDRATGGYWLVARDGGIFGFRAPFHGSAAADAPVAPIVGMAATADGGGYWIATRAGHVYAFGDAHDYGWTGPPPAPIVGIAATADGRGYWLTGADGSVYPFGDATNYGSMRGRALAQPIVGIAAEPATGGYWLVARDGGIFGFRAPFYGSTGNIRLNQPIVGIAATSNGGGYWMVATDGGIFNYGNAAFSGSMGSTHLNAPMVGITGV